MFSRLLCWTIFLFWVGETYGIIQAWRHRKWHRWYLQFAVAIDVALLVWMGWSIWMARNA